jgi:hypothetical protein
MVLPSGVKVHIAAGLTDTRKGMDGFAMMVERLLLEDPFSGHLFAFHGRRANLIKILCRGTATGCICSPSSSNLAALPGRKPMIGVARSCRARHRGVKLAEWHRPPRRETLGRR